MVKPTVGFGCGKWVVAEKDLNRLGTWKRKILRRIYGPVVEQGVWRIGTNQELRELRKDLEILVDIKKKRLEWIGHVVRMDQGRTVKKVLESKPMRGRRRSRLRWLGDVEKDVRVMEIKRRRQQEGDREVWAPVIKETKAVRKPYSQGVSKSTCNALKIAFNAQILQRLFLFKSKAKGFGYFVTARVSYFVARNFLQCGVVNTYQTKRRHITEHRILPFHHSDHFKSNI